MPKHAASTDLRHPPELQPPQHTSMLGHTHKTSTPDSVVTKRPPTTGSDSAPFYQPVFNQEHHFLPDCLEFFNGCHNIIDGDNNL